MLFLLGWMKLKTSGEFNIDYVLTAFMKPKLGSGSSNQWCFLTAFNRRKQDQDPSNLLPSREAKKVAGPRTQNQKAVRPRSGQNLDTWSAMGERLQPDVCLTRVWKSMKWPGFSDPPNSCQVALAKAHWPKIIPSANSEPQWEGPNVFTMVIVYDMKWNH